MQSLQIAILRELAEVSPSLYGWAELRERMNRNAEAVTYDELMAALFELVSQYLVDANLFFFSNE